MVFSSYVVGLFGLFILEFSLWNNFGNYIWYVSIGFTILDMVIGDIVSYQLKEVGGCIFSKIWTRHQFSAGNSAKTAVNVLGGAVPSSCA